MDLLTFQEFFDQSTWQAGKAFLKCGYFWAPHSRLGFIIEAAKMIKNHWEGVLNWFDSLIPIDMLESSNSFIQAAKARTRG